jgi:amicyanin
MRAFSKWSLVLLAAALLVGVLALVSGGMALAWGPGGIMSSGQQGGGIPSMGPMGPMGPMGGYGPGGMMGSGGNGGMIGGSGMMGGGTQGQPSPGTPVAGVTQVSIQNFTYQPANMSVKAGTTVTWTNQDSTPHTVTFRNGMRDSGILRQGQSFSYTFTQPGTYTYYCAYHANMVGTVTVTS